LIIVREVENIDNYLEDACNIIEDKGGKIVSANLISDESFPDYYSIVARAVDMDIVSAIDRELNERHLLAMGADDQT